ncbi:MAG: ankyrin repeat domain-containing protein [Acidobacteria bacterium]|nr:ankyrin repeat domain-containing protein [Acidobacteriota bacterium]
MLVKGLTVSAVAALWLSALMQAAPVSTPVADAAMLGNRDAVRALLKDGADVNSAQADGMTALHWAATKDDVEIVKILLYAGANVRATTRLGGYTPLLLASKSSSAAMIETLVAAGADPNATTTNGTTPLMLAAASGKVDAVKALLGRGANVNAAENAKGETALTFAAAYGRADVIRALASHGADLKTTTKVLDLAQFAREELERFAQQGGGGGGRAGRGGQPEPQQGAQPAAGQPAEASRQPGQRGAAAPAPTEPQGAPAPGRGGRGGGRGGPQVPGVDRRLTYPEQVGYHGGLAPLHIAARQGSTDAVQALVDAGADINQRSAGDKITPIIIATINGHFDLAKLLLDKGADPNLIEDNGVTALYGAINCQWAPKALYPQPRAYEQQQTTYLDLMKALLEKGVNPNARVTKKVWYSGYNFDLSGVDEAGATAFWRAAYAADVDAMKLLVAYGADPNIWTMRTPGRPRAGDQEREARDVSGLPPVPVGAQGVPPLLAAAGVGYGEGFAANSHRFAPGGQLAAVKYLVDGLHVDVNARDHEGNSALHHAAARGDNDMIVYLVSKGADVMAVSREGRTTVDMANGPVQRIQPFPETIKLLEGMGAKNNHRCVSC